MNNKPIKFLLIEDNPGDARLIQELLSEANMESFQVEVAKRLSDGLDALSARRFDVVLLDLSLPDSSGLETLVKVHTKAQKVAIIVLTGLSDKALAAEAVRKGAQDYLVKGQIDENLLYRAILYAIERKQVEEVLKESEEKYRTILENIEDGYFEVDIAGNFTFFNDSLGKILGYSKDELMGMNNRQYTDKENAKITYQAFNKVYRTGKPNIGTQYEIIRKDGTRGQVESSASLMKNAEGQAIGFRGIIRDITERKQAEEQIKASLREKEVLLKEIHHRVKNNLQVISSLLSLQSQHIKDKDSLEMFQESQNRVQSMSLIHEKLYQSNDLSRIDMNEYTKDLTTSLFRSYADSAAIKLKTKVADIFLDITTAIPCGLIINELTSNALKHGFPDRRQGEIAIAMHPANNKIELVVSDTGVGFPEGIDFRNTTTLGMQLVITLVEQLEGTIELDRRAGSAFTICFKGLTYKKRI
jgi:PAS domain S-box-containing protein